jgi:hypothetical protein
MASPDGASPAMLNGVGVEPWPFIAWLAGWHGRHRAEWRPTLRSYFEARAGLLGCSEGACIRHDLRLLGMTAAAAHELAVAIDSPNMPAGAWWTRAPEAWALDHVVRAIENWHKLGSCPYL